LAGANTENRETVRWREGKLKADDERNPVDQLGLCQNSSELRDSCLGDATAVKSEPSSEPPQVSAEPPPLVPLLGRGLTETAETIMFGMQARITSRATERSRALRARQRRQERRQEQKAAKTLSAILLAFIITWTPYNVFAIVQTFCADCVHQHLYEFGR